MFGNGQTANRIYWRAIAMLKNEFDAEEVECLLTDYLKDFGLIEKPGVYVSNNSNEILCQPFSTTLKMPVMLISNNHTRATENGIELVQAVSIQQVFGFP